jgi:hypothetical protein
MNEKEYVNNQIRNNNQSDNLFQIIDTKREQENEVMEAKAVVKELKSIVNIGLKELKKRVKSGNLESNELIKAVNSCIEKAQLLSGKATSISIRKTMTKEQMMLILARPSEAAKIAAISKGADKKEADKKEIVLKLMGNGGGNE